MEPQTTPDAAAQAQAQAFTRWVEGFRTSARAAGVNEATLHSALDNVRFLPRVIELDRSQPEFTRAVWTYLDTAVSAQRVARGQAQMQVLRSVPNPALRLDAIAARYGVAPELLVAVWGIESNYGTHMGDMPAIDALATLAFEGRREAWARSELILALKILQSGDIARDQMLGSWAGAMGQTQFIPSVFTAYAVDADGDGHRDIWGSLPDVMASTANFFNHAGWQAGQAWGLEVRLPSGFDYARADTAIRQSAAQWAQEGVQAMSGTALPALPDASLLLPAGARGPAFLVGQNFRTVLRYNNSISYALAVSLLAQRLAGGPAVQAAWPRDVQPLSRAQVLALQTALNARGFDCGTPDGMVGPATQRGVRQYQRSVGLPADGFPTLELLQGVQALL
jgi:membrane-bound lytic murein transglycosylase B